MDRVIMCEVTYDANLDNINLIESQDQSQSTKHAHEHKYDLRSMIISRVTSHNHHNTITCF